jgi:hypothetical protein
MKSSTSFSEIEKAKLKKWYSANVFQRIWMAITGNIKIV